VDLLFFGYMRSGELTIPSEEGYDKGAHCFTCFSVRYFLKTRHPERKGCGHAVWVEGWTCVTGGQEKSLGWSERSSGGPGNDEGMEIHGWGPGRSDWGLEMGTGGTEKSGVAVAERGGGMKALGCGHDCPDQEV
jgi:hypothetical protein